MTEPIRYFDANNREVHWHTINTICPIEHADAGRMIAHRHLVEFEKSHDAVVAQMLHVMLAPVGGCIPTHVFCSREGLCHQVESLAKHLAQRKEEWISRMILTEADGVSAIKSKYCIVLGDKDSLLNFLGLREVS